jgi:hypothetical protein
MSRQDQMIDPDRSCCLCGAGAPEYIAATTVSPDGSENLVLVRWDALGDDETVYDASCWDVAHERTTGPLPANVLERIWMPEAEVFWCSGVNKRGLPCGMRVDRQGDRCVFHRDRSAST